MNFNTLDGLFGQFYGQFFGKYFWTLSTQTQGKLLVDIQSCFNSSKRMIFTALVMIDQDPEKVKKKYLEAFGICLLNGTANPIQFNPIPTGFFPGLKSFIKCRNHWDPSPYIFATYYFSFSLCDLVLLYFWRVLAIWPNCAWRTAGGSLRS